MSGQCNFTIPKSQCTLDTCCIERQGNIQYQPTLVGNGIYAGIFLGILLAQVVLLFLHRKTWGFFVGIFCGLLLEVLGYVGRILLHNNPFLLKNFVLYLVCLTIAPAFIMGSIYLLIGRVVVAYGPHHGVVKPLYYSAICMTGDFISLLLQALGGALAATGVSGDKARSDLGVHIMMGGLAFQLFATIIFAVLSAFFFRNVLRNKSDRNPQFVHVTSSWKFKAMLAAVFVATLTIFIRSAFRVAELKDGFSSALANDQTLFMIFEGPMLIIATAALTAFHPGYAFQGQYGDANWGVKTMAAETSSDQLEMNKRQYSSY